MPKNSDADMVIEKEICKIKNKKCFQSIKRDTPLTSSRLIQRQERTFQNEEFDKLQDDEEENSLKKSNFWNIP